jgi:pimeloyl-ACP methyl ester carboxylesterase
LLRPTRLIGREVTPYVANDPENPPSLGARLRGPDGREWRFEASDAERIDAPVLVGKGERTAELSAVPPESVALLAAMMPRAEIVELAGRSHLMPLEDPVGVARLIVGFVRRHPITAGAP